MSSTGHVLYTVQYMATILQQNIRVPTFTTVLAQKGTVVPAQFNTAAEKPDQQNWVTSNLSVQESDHSGLGDSSPVNSCSHWLK